MPITLPPIRASLLCPACHHRLYCPSRGTATASLPPRATSLSPSWSRLTRQARHYLYCDARGKPIPPLPYHVRLSYSLYRDARGKPLPASTVPHTARLQPLPRRTRQASPASTVPHTARSQPLPHRMRQASPRLYRTAYGMPTAPARYSLHCLYRTS